MTYLAQDVEAADSALAVGRALAEVAPKSPLRLALRQLAADLSGASLPTRRGRKR